MQLQDGVYLTRFEEDGVILIEDVAGILVDTNSGKFIEMNRIGLEMLESMLEYPSDAQIVSALQEKIDADQPMLEEGLASLREQLHRMNLVL